MAVLLTDGVREKEETMELAKDYARVLKVQKLRQNAKLLLAKEIDEEKVVT